MKKLTAKQDRFTQEYLLNGFNATQAAIEAGYSKKTAYSIGQENLKKPEILNRIKEKQTDLAEAAGVSALKIAEELKILAFSSMAEFHENWIELKQFEDLTEIQKACIAEIQSKTVQRNDGAEVVFVKVKLHEKLKAIDSLRNLLGYTTPQKMELSGKDGDPLFPGGMDLSKLSNEELKRLHDLLQKATPPNDNEDFTKINY
jgi:phage terminase small subunit